MRVAVVLCLLAVSAFALRSIKPKKLIGGPNSLPYFLRPGYVKPTPVAEQSGFTDDIKNKATEIQNRISPRYNVFKNQVAENTRKFRDVISKHVEGTRKWFNSKLSKPEVAPVAPVAPVAEQSGFTEDIQAKATEFQRRIKPKYANFKNKTIEKVKKIKNAVVEGAKKIKTRVVDGVKKAHKWAKEKVTGKKEEVAPVVPVAPVAEQSGFTEDIKAKATEFHSRIRPKYANFKNKAVEKVKKVKDTVVNGVKRAHKWIKEKVTGKKEEVAPVAPVAPVAEQSDFAEDFNQKFTQAKEKSKQWFNKLSIEAQNAYKAAKKRLTQN